MEWPAAKQWVKSSSRFEPQNWFHWHVSIDGNQCPIKHEHSSSIQFNECLNSWLQNSDLPQHGWAWITSHQLNSLKQFPTVVSTWVIALEIAVLFLIVQWLKDMFKKLHRWKQTLFSHAMESITKSSQFGCLCLDTKQSGGIGSPVALPRFTSGTSDWWG